MHIKRSIRFRARPSKAPNRLVVLPIKWPSLTKSTTPAIKDEALDAPSSAQQATPPPSLPTILSSLPPTRRPDLSPASSHPPTHSSPIRPTLKPDDRSLRHDVSREGRHLLTSIIRAVFSPSTDLPAFFSSLEDEHIPETVKLLEYLHKVELEKQAHHGHGHRKQQQSLLGGKVVEGLNAEDNDEARAFLYALGRKVRALAEENDRLQDAAVAGQEERKKSVPGSPGTGPD